MANKIIPIFDKTMKESIILNLQQSEFLKRALFIDIIIDSYVGRIVDFCKMICIFMAHSFALHVFCKRFVFTRSL